MPLREGKPHVLVVEDDETQLWVLEKILSDHYPTKLLESAERAIAYIESGARIDLLVTDFDLRSEKDGLDVVEVIRQRLPEVPILLITATLPTLARVRAVLSSPRTIYVEKPFTLDEFEHAFEQARGFLRRH